MNCKICEAHTEEIFKARLLNKYDVQYYHCPACRFVQTEPPYWLNEAYQNPINLSDTGVVSRNLLLALKTSLIIQFLFNRKAKFIDYAGGWGIFTRLMRDIGFDFFWYDKFTRNEVARGFEANLSDHYELITIFEAFEHFEDPIIELGNLFQLSNAIFFTTTPLPSPTPNPGDWWYYGLDHGQHIAFYSQPTFEKIASRFGCSYLTDGKSIHLLTKKKISRGGFRFLTSLAGLILLPLVFLTNKSRTQADYDRMTGGV